MITTINEFRSIYESIFFNTDVLDKKQIKYLTKAKELVDSGKAKNVYDIEEILGFGIIDKRVLEDTFFDNTYESNANISMFNTEDNNELTDEMRANAETIITTVNPNEWPEYVIGIVLMFSEPNGIWSEDKESFYTWIEANVGDYPNLDKKLKNAASKYLKNIDYTK